MQITQSTNVVIRGVTESSKTDNLRLEAKVNNNTVASDDFTVLWVTLALRTSGSVSPDNNAAQVYSTSLGTTNLGLFYSRGADRQIWRHGVEIVGTVAPSDFPYLGLRFRREIVGFKVYLDNNPTPVSSGDRERDIFDSRLQDTALQPRGAIYDLDAPGIYTLPSDPIGLKQRRRVNFRQWVDFGGTDTAAGVKVSDDLLWFQRQSIQKTSGEDAVVNDLPNDNIVGSGQTDLGLGTTGGTPPGTPPRATTFVSQSVANYMDAGGVYDVSITLRNAGSETWTAAGDYKLGTQNPQDNTLWTGGTRVYLPEGVSVPPGAEYTFNFTVYAPYTSGLYNFQWQMVQDGVEWFGDYTPNVVVDVYASSYCDPWQEQDCWNRGGSWDSSTCQCYGGYNY